MKFLIAIPVACLILFSSSCTKDKTAEPAPPYNCDSVTYNSHTKLIIQTNCAEPTGTCHSISFAQSGIILDNYPDTKFAFENHAALCTIEQTGGCVPMPDQAPKLPDSLINIIRCWIANGYPE